MSIEIMKQALEALETPIHAQPFGVKQNTIAALRLAIEQAEKQDALESMADNARETGLDYTPMQEPVAWITEWDGNFSSGKLLDFERHRRGPSTKHIPLYIAPPQPDPCPYIRSTAEGTHHCALSQRPPLTEDEFRDLMREVYNIDIKEGDYSDDILLVRAVERAHGIGGEHD